MSSHYTDVDRLIFERWNDVLDLQDAFRALNDRIRLTIEGALQKTERWLDEQGYRCEFDAKSPEVTAWKPSWEAKRGRPCVRLKVAGFAPFGYARNTPAHPYLWVLTEELSQLKLKEGDRVQFARQLREALGPSASKWDHDEVSDADEPLGKYLGEIADKRRIELVADPNQLVQFLRASFAELFEMTPILDAALLTLKVK